MTGWAIDAVFSDARFISRIRRTLLSYARRRFPALQGLSEDLVAAAIEGLWQYALQNPAPFEGMDPSAEEPWTSEAWQTVERLGRTIVVRRAIDLNRREAGKWAHVHLDALLADSESEPVQVPADDPTPARSLLLRQMVAVCLAELADASPADRDALLDAIDRDAPSGAMSAAQRQRASRLRRRLAQAIRERLGESAAALLAADLDDKG